jgi:hypothetical protein
MENGTGMIMYKVVSSEDRKETVSCKRYGTRSWCRLLEEEEETSDFAFGGEEWRRLCVYAPSSLIREVGGKPCSNLPRLKSDGTATRFHFVQDWVSREDHQCQHGHFDHLFDALDPPPKDLGLEWAEVGGHAAVAAVLEPAHSEGFGIEPVLGNIPVWLVEVAHTRAYSQAEGRSDHGDREVDMHPSLHGGRRSSDSAQMEKDLGSVRKPVVEGVVGTRTESHGSMTPSKRETWKVAGIVV